MEVNIVFKIYYSREKDGSLSKFREKYFRLKSHIERLQALGTLPRGEVRWSVEHQKPEPPLPRGPAAIAGFILPQSNSAAVAKPRLVHSAGTRLDPARIAM